MPRSSREAAARSRETILGEVVDEAAVNGLDGITIGNLADRLEMSKAGVIGPFGSKEQLQVEALDRAAAIFRADVWDPEPPPPDDRVLAHPATVVTPHVAGLTDMTYREICSVSTIRSAGPDFISGCTPTSA